MKLLVVKTKTTGSIQNDAQRILDPLGSITAFVKSGESVLVKPNCNTADPFPASTSLDFLEAVVNLVKSQSPSKIIIGDSCTIFQKTEKVFIKKGLPELCERLGVELMNFDKEKHVTKKLNGQYLKKIRVPEVLDHVDRIITLPCLKVHRFARFTMSLKLAVALMKKIDRTKMHMKNLEEKVAEINLVYKPDLIIMDGRKAFITRGPEEGDVVKPNVLMASTDRIAIDIEALKLLLTYNAENKLTKDIWQLPQIKYAVNLNIGVARNEDYETIEV